MKIAERVEYATKPKPLTCDPDDLVLDAVKRMADKNYGSIIAVDKSDHILGMMTERDIMKRLIAEGRDPKKTKVGDIMTSSVRTAKADDDLNDWLRIMSNERFRRLPIVDNDDKLQSIMTQGDFVSYTWPELMQQATTMAKATFGETLSLPRILAGILAYTLLLIIAVSLIR
ncbi:CBS domain-containing protein [Parasphingorhabdus cellanae]|uniref:CBS domain-containing protein n=2 Tax=Parasphingorhabdus cellanae TaxID=2806553 RepID=A0ABX7T7X7_9SPHN|nr:CBS domain-containing protein [Parasphingorhabdus cellanae]